MRQAGIIAAAGIVALEQMTERLSEDHVRAKRLAEGLAAIPGITFPQGQPQTNMVFPGLATEVKKTTHEIAKELAKEDILVDPVTDRLFRLVTHYWISDDAVEKTIKGFKKAIQS
jgi:threonine aldolase